jgi:hypothetical protein
MSFAITSQHKNIPFPPQKSYLRRSAWRNKTMFKTMCFFLCPGVETYLDTEKNIVLNIVSFPPLNYPPSVLAVLLVVMLVVVLLSCCCRCLHLLCCRVANTAAAATVGMPPPPLPPPLPSVGEEDDTCYTNADSSPATLVQAVCRALESRTSLDRPLPAGCAGGKGGDNDGGTNGGGQSRIVHWIGMVLLSPTRGGMTVTRVAGE